MTYRDLIAEFSKCSEERLDQQVKVIHGTPGKYSITTIGAVLEIEPEPGSSVDMAAIIAQEKSKDPNFQILPGTILIAPFIPEDKFGLEGA